ncbi:unnamed protein product [Auanema sp. JU1783]|nr:unnamed protein product [Auanema sp. JU1783]
MKIILTFCLLAIGFSFAEEASSTVSSLEISTEIVDTSVETSTDVNILSTEERILTESTKKEETIVPSTVNPTTEEFENTSIKTDTSSVTKTSTTDFDEQNEEDVVDDDDEDNDDEDEENEHDNTDDNDEDSKENSKTTETPDVNINNPLALVGDNTTTVPTVTPALPRPPSFTAGSFFIGLLLGLVLLAVAYFGYVYYQRRKSLPAAGYRSYP